MLRLIEFISVNFNPRMSEKQPTLKQRINLLECAAEVVRDHAASTGRRVLGEMADVIFTEVEAMKIANRRFELQREARKNAKTAPKGTAVTN